MGRKLYSLFFAGLMDDVDEKSHDTTYIVMFTRFLYRDHIFWSVDDDETHDNPKIRGLEGMVNGLEPLGRMGMHPHGNLENKTPDSISTGSDSLIERGLISSEPFPTSLSSARGKYQLLELRPARREQVPSSDVTSPKESRRV